MKTILYLTDLYYLAKGRNYYEEDLYITQHLYKHFNILIAHPQQAIDFLEYAELIVFRNTGPVIAYEQYFRDFVRLTAAGNLLTFNSFDGKADIRGKQYLVDLFQLGYPVIPTVERIADIDRLGDTEQYIVKIKNGADSIGMEVLSKKALEAANSPGKLIQPYLNLRYEVSFYFLDSEFQYALYAPDRQRRWELVPYTATAADLRFAQLFISWNNMTRGITRVDAGRLDNEKLLLVELEDLNPFLSLSLLGEPARDQFMFNLVSSLKRALA